MKKAIVTGGNKGIGLEITRMLMDQGIFVYVVARDFKGFLSRNLQEEVAKTVVWLATESPEYINGICIDINNGAFPR